MHNKVIKTKFLRVRRIANFMNLRKSKKSFYCFEVKMPSFSSIFCLSVFITFCRTLDISNHQSNNHCVKSVQMRKLFLVRIFQHSDWIRRDTEYGKIRTRKNSVLGLFSRSEYDRGEISIEYKFLVYWAKIKIAWIPVT